MVRNAFIVCCAFGWLTAAALRAERPETAAPAPPAPLAPDTKLSFPKGQLIQKVISRSDSTQSFILYIPKSYNPAKPAPVLYLLDARGRAKIPAELFRPAAEKYGYLMLSSYDSASDGPLDPNLKAMQAMWNDSHAWFKVDDKRIYAVGFSGTVRSSILMATTVPGSITGIIGAAAGFPQEYPPKKDTDFLFYGTGGDLDFNYWEMIELDEKLTALGLPHRVELFSGPHGWMPPELATAGVEWMEVQAMKAGSRPKDPALIEELWKGEIAAAEALAAAGRTWDAAQRYTAAARDFQGLRDTAAASATGQDLAQSKAGKEQAKERKAEAGRYARYVQDAAQALFAPDTGDDAPMARIGQVLSQLRIARLKEEAKKLDTEAGRAAKRMLSTISAQVSFYLPRQAMDRKDYTRAAFLLAIATEVNPEGPMAWYMSALVHAKQGLAKKALEDLDRAAEVGLQDPGLFEDEALKGLRGEAGYQSALEKVKRNLAASQQQG
jgi:hypothetical protein